MKPDDFRTLVWGYYKNHKRTMPWRENTDPYWVLVSEIMLQQTQVERVKPKFDAFVSAFPSVKHLASAPFTDVLAAWLGLGYNRRARYLHQAAQQIVEEHEARVPNEASKLQSLPGIGPNTAAAIQAYAFNEPTVFVETNIRSVIIHHYFNDKSDVTDAEILSVATQVLDTAHPREWYWALMDYGTFIKQTTENPGQRSRHHMKQKPFKGSLRELRGKVLREIALQPQSISDLQSAIPDGRLPGVVETLSAEGFIYESNDVLQISE